MGKDRSTPKNLNRRPTVEKKPTKIIEVVRSVLKGSGRAVAEPEKTPFKSPDGRMELSTPERNKAVQVITCTEAQDRSASNVVPGKISLMNSGCTVVQLPITRESHRIG